MTQKFKGSIVESKWVIDNIMGFYDAATAEHYNNGMQWYKNANQVAVDIACTYGKHVEQTVGIIAAFSPQCDWDNNLKYAETFLRTGTTGRTKYQLSIAEQVLKLETQEEIRKALSTTPDGAPKVRAFYDCILDPYCESVVVDRHAIACALQKPTTVGVLDVNVQRITPQQYAFIAYCYDEAARYIGILPNQIQAITWETYRSLRKLKQHSMFEL